MSTHLEETAVSTAVERLTFTGRPGVPTQVGPFCHATRWGGLLMLTGQMPTDPDTGALVPGGLIPETRQVLRNLQAVVREAGARWDDILMVRVYLTDFDDFDAFNAEYRQWFPAGLPARTCVGVTGLAVGACVEIDLVVADTAGSAPASTTLSTPAPAAAPSDGATR
ncbi:RidA family protein [Nakamurella flava]|uniref:RidA family protein n=1 Tax=Nakamurella flava TaxID=2576308 RepID=A0A4U6QDY8_9ACTN|nr:RidA family protein [Nakamurella flava]TKV58333.1 RidA family protein [Nakamurella flava]